MVNTSSSRHNENLYIIYTAPQALFVHAFVPLYTPRNSKTMCNLFAFSFLQKPISILSHFFSKKTCIYQNFFVSLQKI